MIQPERGTLLTAAFCLVCAFLKFAHLRILWVEEAYALAAGQQLLRGAALYRDVWFDKPAFYAGITLLWGAHTGWPLRLAGALYVLLAAYLAYRFARDIASAETPGLLAAALMAFFLTFGIPAAVMPLAPDLLMIVPHLLAVWLAWRNQPFACGLAAGLALDCNTKAVYVLAACLLWQWRAWWRVLLGTTITGVLGTAGAPAAYWQQVWWWGMQYAADPLYAHPWREGIWRTLNWMGFHAALVAGGAFGLWQMRDRWRWLGWIALSALAVFTGGRFFPRYYFQLLPPLVVLAAIGWTAVCRMRRDQTPMLNPESNGLRARYCLALVILLLVPLVRFGPRYAMLAADLVRNAPHRWSDLALSQDSEAASALVRQAAHPGDTMLVWGYRPEVFAWTGLPAATRFLDSQPLTGVLADRHLTQSRPTFPALAASNRAELRGARPTFLVDGLGPYNGSLALSAYPDLRDWLAQYEVIGRTPGTVIYRLRLPEP